MTADKNYKKLRLFVASPGDVVAERRRLRDVVDELNRTGSLGDELGVTLEVLDWQTHVAPFMGRPEDVILEQLPVDAWDIFVGILWLRFGTPTGGTDPETGKAYDSGTEEEFLLAHKAWKKNKRPQILFYRCTRVPASLDDIDPDQHKRVKGFFAQFHANAEHPGPYQSFQTPEEFERRVRQDLIKLILKFGKEVLRKQPPAPAKAVELPGDEITRRYLDFVRREHGRIRLFGFLSHANIDVRLLDVFVSLRLAEYGREMEMKHLPRLSLTNSGKKGRGLPAPESREERLLNPAEVLQRAVRKQKSLLVLGGPGSGKTTLLKYFAVCCLDPPGRERLHLQNSRIPIFAPLRQIDPAKPFADALAAWAKTHNLPLSAKRFEAWLHEPGALVLLDGLDEVSDLRQRRQICDWIDKAVSSYGASTFVVTCRFTGYREAEGVALQSPHLRADVQDLDAGQQQTFLQQWFRAALREKLEAHETDDPVRGQEIEREAAAEAEAVSEFLRREENRSLADMASIPVLLQIMAIIWKEQGSLAGERVELYSRCMDFLLEHRDQAKKIEPLVSAAKARLVLRPLALWMHADLQKDEAPRVEVEKQIADKLQAVRPGTTALEFLENLRDRAGVLVGSGADTYTFQHKSFREFLAALEIANQNAVNLLVENFGVDWWQETLLFSAGLTSPEIFPAFIESFLKHDKNAGATSPLLLQLVREAAAKPLAPFEKIIRNQKLAWPKRYNALQCVRLLRSEAAKALLQAARQDKEPKVRQLAEQILIEWAVIKPPAAAAEKPNRFFNPLEDNAEYILIPGGKYKFSATGKMVKVPDLYVAKYPVTNKLYKIFLASLPESEREEHRSSYADDKRFNGDDQPVVGVNWYSAKAYCDWLSKQVASGKSQDEKLIFRLPKEEEWEWAASGGTRKYPWGNEDPDETRANYGNYVGHTTSVGAYPAGATPEGLMDMAGNVWEWTESFYRIGSELRVLCGGAWGSYPQLVACAFRYDLEPDGRVSYIGFRCART
ncbi:MAG: SUMF1/EgtB/PvdO family nonheme iron enzyme [candidate division KSB1 bacterium]|nr:SUMF1/EgtB/PvdO family nonheme iron enzyme [candidate division KSB1 bacterium]MDZ7369085.1 SUMF1/EgtB/PvdO family nonheme iron enzyme [candidate division KSB1 bacterium]MDZ7407077.1 SUMF1/EgtB/PvdO family nonheme iron enzyme [candidate division KSB1 bacterium]